MSEDPRPRRRTAADTNLRSLTTVHTTLVSVLIDALGRAEPTMAYELRDRLRNLGADAVPALHGALVQVLQSKEPASLVALRYLDCLEDLGPESLPVVPTLLPLLTTAPPPLRTAVLRVVRAVGPDARRHAAEVVDLLDSPEANLRRHALLTLGALGIRDAAWQRRIIECLCDTDSGVRQAATLSLRGLGVDAIDAMLKAFEDADFRLKVQLVWAFGRLGGAAARATSVLAQCLDAATPAHLRRSAIRALGALGEGSLKALRASLNHGSEQIKQGACAALTIMAQEWGPLPALKTCVPGLILAMNETPLRRVASETLEAMGPLALDALQELLEGEDRQQVVLSCQILGQMQEAATPAVPKLLELLESEQQGVRQASVRALANIGQSALKALRQTLLTGSALSQQGALQSLGAMAREGLFKEQLPSVDWHQFIPRLIQSLTVEELRDDAAYSLSALGLRAVPALCEFFERESDELALRACLWALGRMGEEALEASEVLLNHAKTSAPGLRGMIVDTLAHIGPALVPKLISDLSSEDDSLLIERILDRLGVRALPPLIEASAKHRSFTLMRSMARLGVSLEDGHDDLIRAFLASLEDSSAQGRQAGIEALATFLLRAPEVIVRSYSRVLSQALLGRLNDEDELVQRRSLSALVHLGSPAVAPLLESLLSDHTELRQKATYALGQMGEKAMPGLIDVLQTNNAHGREEAARALAQLSRAGVVVDDAVGPLIRALDDEVCRCAASFALGEIDQRRHLSVPALIKQLSVANAEARWWALHALGRQARRELKEGWPAMAQQALLELGDALTDEAPENRSKAAWALAGFGHQAEVLGPRLFTAAREGLDEAYLALRTGGYGSRKQLERLQQLWRSPAAVQEVLAEVMELPQGVKASPEVLAALRAGLDHPRAVLRWACLCALAFLESAARPLFEPIFASLKRPGAGRLAALRALSRLGREVLPELLAVFMDPARALPMRRFAAVAMMQVVRDFSIRKKTTKDSRHAALELMAFASNEDEDSQLRGLALVVLGHLGVERGRVMAVLCRQLVEPSRHNYAIRGLLAVGTPALDSIVAELAKPGHRDAALQAFKGIVFHRGLSQSLPQLLEVLKTGEASARRAAARVLEEAAQSVEGPSPSDSHHMLPSIEMALSSEDSETRGSVLKTMAGLGRDASQDDQQRIVKQLERALEDQDPAIRQLAGQCLADYLPVQEQAIERLARDPGSVEASVRQRSAQVLGQCLQEPEELDKQRAEDILLKLTDDPSFLVRRQAVASLAYSEASERVTQKLVEATSDRDFKVRWNALWSLWSVGPESCQELIKALPHDPKAIKSLAFVGKAAVPHLVPVLKQPKVRDNAIQALVLIGSSAIPDLIEALLDEDTRPQASRALGLIGLNAFPALVKSLANPDRRDYAAKAIADMGAVVLERLVKVFPGCDPGGREGLLRSLEYLAPRLHSEQRRRCQRLLFSALEDPNLRVRARAARTIGFFGPELCHRDTLFRLSQLLPHDFDVVLEECVQTVARLSPELKSETGLVFQISPALLQTLDSPKGAVREASIQALQALGEKLLPALESLYKTADTSMRRSILKIVESFAMDSGADKDARARALKLLRFGLSDDQAALNRVALEALGRVPKALSDSKVELGLALNSGQVARLDACLRALRNLGSRAKPAVPLLLEIFEKQSLKNRERILQIIENQGPRVAEHSEAMLVCLQQPEPLIRAMSARVLGQIGHKDSKLFAALATVLDDSRENVRVQACRAIVRVAPETEALLPLLAKRLLDASTKVRLGALEAVAWLGSEADALKGQLLDFASKSGPKIAKAALRALGRLSVKPSELKEIIESLTSKSRQALTEAALFALKESLRQAGRGDKPELVRWVWPYLTADKASVRSVSLETLAELCPLPDFIDRKELELMFRENLRHPVEIVRRRCLRALEKSAFCNEAMIFALSRRMRKSLRRDERRSLIQCLGHLKAPNDDQRRALVSLLLGQRHGVSAEWQELILEALGRQLLPGDLTRSLGDIDWAIKSESALVRQAALRVLLILKIHQPNVIERVVHLSGDPEYAVRRLALRAIGRLGRGSPLVFECLVERVNDEDLKLRQLAESLLVRLGSENQSLFPVLEKALERRPVDQWPALLEVLRTVSLRRPKLSVSVLIVGLTSGDAASCIAAADILKGLGRKAQAAIPALRRCLNHSDLEVRKRSCEALGAIGPMAAEAVSSMVPLLSSDADRDAVIEALGEMGPGARAALPHLLPLLAGLDKAGRKRLTSTIENIGRANEKQVPLLIPLLTHLDPEVRFQTADLIAQLGSKAGLALPDFVALMGDSNNRVASLASQRVDQLGPASLETLPGLIALLTGTNDEVCLKAVKLIGKAGREARTAVDPLLPLLKNNSADLRKAAAWALGRMGRYAEPACEALESAAFDSDEAVRNQVEWALLEIKGA